MLPVVVSHDLSNVMGNVYQTEPVKIRSATIQILMIPIVAVAVQEQLLVAQITGMLTVHTVAMVSYSDQMQQVLEELHQEESMDTKNVMVLMDSRHDIHVRVSV